MAYCKKSVKEISKNVFLDLITEYDNSITELNRVERLVKSKQIQDDEDYHILDKLQQNLIQTRGYLQDASENIFCEWSLNNKCFVPIFTPSSKVKSMIQNKIISPLIDIQMEIIESD